MDGSIQSRVSHEVDNWLRWLPRWRPGTHRSRPRLCRQCFGSPIISAAGLATDVPHAVQHALAMRMKLVIDAAVDEYTDKNLPLLRREMRMADERKALQAYRPAEGLDPEYKGLELDPPASPDAPYLFTFDELARSAGAATEADGGADDASETPTVPQQPPLSAEEKAAIRVELKLADDYANQVGKLICAELLTYQSRIVEAVAAYVEPQVQALLADLESTLDSPLWPRGT